MVSSISSSVSSWASTLFSQLDTSKKGYISESDLSSAFSALGSGSSDSANSASKLFGTLDSNNDGKVTQDELANTLQNLSDQLNSQYDASRMASAMSGAMPPPPPPPGDNSGEDAGLTKDQLSSIASTTTDSNLASLMNNVASNFSAADTNGDGKVSSAEAMAYQQSTSSSAASTTSSASDAGLTKEQLTSIASTTKDGNLASLMNSVASNFSTADTNGDGKVSQAEAMAYKESTESASSAASSSSDSQTLKHILELLQAYTTKQSTSNSSLSLSA